MNESSEQLRLFIERIERMNEEKADVVKDIADTYSEAKGAGFDTKAMREVIKLRKMDANTRQEADAMLDLYKSLVGL